MKKILITGGTGFVGGRLAKRLSAEHEVFISSRKKLTADQLKFYGSVRAVEHSNLLEKESFPAVDSVIHLAALNEWDSVKYPSEAIRVNVDESRIILENSISAGAERFIYFSTAHIYGSPLAGKITEDTLPIPAHPYSITHRAAEDYVAAATLSKRIRGTIFRLSNSFGAPVSPDVNRWTLLANDLCRQAVENGKMLLKSNGCQYRDFISLTDVEDVIISLLNREKPLENIIYNLGSGHSVRVIDMAREIEQLCTTILKKNVPVELPDGAKETEEARLELSVSKLLSEGFHLNNNIRAELEKLLLFCSDHFKH